MLNLHKHSTQVESRHENSESGEIPIVEMVGRAKCGLSFAGLHEKSQKSCRPASNSTLQAYSYLLMIKL